MLLRAVGYHLDTSTALKGCWQIGHHAEKKRYEGKEDLNYNQKHSKREQEENISPGCHCKGCQKAAHTSKMCQMLLLLPRNGAAGLWWRHEQMAMAGRSAGKGGRERRETQLPKYPALALLTVRDLTQFLSISKRTLNVDLLACDLQVCIK